MRQTELDHMESFLRKHDYNWIRLSDRIALEIHWVAADGSTGSSAVEVFNMAQLRREMGY